MAKKNKAKSRQNRKNNYTKEKHLASRIPNVKLESSPSKDMTLDELEQEIKVDIGKKTPQTKKRNFSYNQNMLLEYSYERNKTRSSSLKTSVRDLSEEKKILENILTDKKNDEETTMDFSQKNGRMKKRTARTSRRNRLGALLKVFLFLFVVIIISLFFVVSPKIDLNGDKQVVLTYNQKYEESGATATYLGKDITDEIKVSGKVDTSKVGEYKVTYEVDRFIFHIKEKRTVKVIDQENPVLELEGDQEVNICPNGEYQDAGYRAYDEYDGDLTSQVQVEKKEDRYIYTVVDSSGNQTQKERLIKQVDQEAPVITLKGGQTIYITPNQAFQEPGFTANDNCAGDITDQVKVSGQVSPNQLGTYTLTYTVSDQAGNKASVSRKVVVSERTDPNSGVSKAGVIYLTFDDGPNAATTSAILDVLKEEGVKATFFVTNNGPDELIKRAYDEGHTIGLHTASHRYDIVYSSVDNYFNDLKTVSDRVKRITGHESKIIRFPGGSSNTISRKYKQGIMTELTEAVLNQGYRYYDWNVDASDAWQCTKSSVSNKKDCVYQNVVKGLSKSRANIVLMHDVKPHTRDALRDIIRYGKENGYTFEAIDMDTKMVRFSVNN